MKSFLIGLCLATGLALLNSMSAPLPAMCLVFPDLRAAAAEMTGDDCVSACRLSASRRSAPLVQ
jgi:hypothetical protein